MVAPRAVGLLLHGAGLQIVEMPEVGARQDENGRRGAFLASSLPSLLPP